MDSSPAATMRLMVQTIGAAFAGVVLFALSACSGGDWPKLVDVQRPRASETYAVPAPAAPETPAAEPTAPPAPPGAVIPLTPKALNTTKVRLDAALAELNAADTAYSKALRNFLAISQDGETLDEAWAAAQNQLTRLGAAVDELKAVDDDLAALGLGAKPDTPPGLTLELAREIARAETALAGRARALLFENNRLAVLTPRRAGAPGPNAAEAKGRSAFVLIDLADPDAAFATPLVVPIKRALEVAGDLHFDVIAAGADRSRAQANLRRVTAALLNLGVPRDQLVIALEPDAAAAPEVAIYLRAKSA